MELASVLREGRAKAQITQAQLAEKLDVHFTTVSQRERGVAELPADQLRRFAQATEQWLCVSPDGEWQLGPPGLPTRSDPWREERSGDQAKPQVELMVYGHVSAGPGIVNEEDGQWLDMIEVWRRHVDGVALVTGDSMEPMLREGDWVGVRLEEDMPRYGDIAVFRNGWSHEVQIKVWGGIRGEEATLLSLNPTHGPVHRRLGELQILGVAYGLLRPGRLRAPW